MLQLAYKPKTWSFDLGRNGKNIVDDPTLCTACLLSLFTRRQANTDDELPDPHSTNREGWWADAYADVEEDKWGSRLWLLSRAKADTKTLEDAKTYVIEALTWMVEDGVAASVDCETEWHEQAGSDPLLAIKATITKPNDPTRWSALWLANLALL